MEEIINKVIEIDTSAKRFIKSAEDKKANLDEYMKNESIKIQEQINNLMENNLEKEKIKLNERLEEEKRKITGNTDEELARLDEYVAANKDRLVGEIYNNIYVL